jgi:hypothetical protein
MPTDRPGVHEGWRTALALTKLLVIAAPSG